jgi:glycosyltransferase involved in cell wall biosynthesis
MMNDILFRKSLDSNERVLHIAIICREMGGQGSVASVALRQAKELARYARVTLLSDSFPDDVDPYLAKHLVRPFDFSFLRRFSHVPRELSFAFAAKRHLFRLEKEGAELDFVHCHGHSLIAFATQGIKNRYNIPCGLVAHGDVFSSPPGTYDWRLTKFFKWAIPRGYAQADLIIAVSPFMRERAIACGADPTKVHIVPNGIEIGEIGLNSAIPVCNDSNASVVVGGSLKLLFVGVLNERKGVDVLLHAAKMLKDNDIRFSLKIVGAGPLRRQLGQLIALHGLSKDVELLGKTPRSELGKWYQWADATCVPSINDPLPTVVLESLVAGKPIVGSAVGGIPFMVQSEVNGILVPPKNPEALSSALARIAQQPGLLRRLKEASRPSVFPRFSWERNGIELFQMIDRNVNGTMR